MTNKTVLPNGIRVLTEYMPEAYSATVMVWIDAGPDIENERVSGISHFIEHMLFKGTKSRSAKQIVENIENSGGNINAYTDKETCCYYAKVLSQKVPETIDTLLDMLLNSRYDNSDLEVERQVILEEIKMYEDTPDELVHDLLIKSVWNDHPLGQPVTGTHDTIANISREDILEFVKSYYTSDNLIISISGNFDEEATLSQISKISSGLNTTSKPKNITKPTFTSNISLIEKDTEQSHICIGARGVSVLDQERYALAIIDICLGGGMASRLFQEIREKRGLVYCINTYEAMYRSAGLFGVYAGTNPSNVKEVLKLVNEEIHKLKEEGLSDEELDKTKTQLKGSLLIGLESTRYRASRNGRSEMYFNRIITTEEICQEIDRVTHKDIKNLCNCIFDNSYVGMTIIGPKVASEKELVLSY